MESTLDTLAKVIVPVLLGSVGWYTSNFIVGPWQEFLRLRQSIHENLIYFAKNISSSKSSETDREEWRQCSDEIRRLSSKLHAQYESFARWHLWWANLKGFQIKKAAESLMGLSNLPDMDWANVHDDEVRRFLKLPVVLRESIIQKIRSRIGL